MRTKILNLIIIVVMINVSGCSTPYKESGFMGGYTDSKIGEGQYLVTFTGNGYTSMGQAKQYALRRASEVCSNDGYSKYIIVDSKDQTVSRASPTSFNCATRGNNTTCTEQVSNFPNTYPYAEFVIKCDY